MAVDALVLDAELRQSLVAVRSLGRRGLRVAAYSANPQAVAFVSRWCANQCVGAGPDQPDACFTRLADLLERLRPRVVIASHDGTVAIVREWRKWLEPRVRVAVAEEPAVAVAVDKERTLVVAEALGIRIPLAVTLERAAQVPAAIARVGLPAVVKPTESWHPAGPAPIWIGPTAVASAEEARAAVRNIVDHGGAALFQRLLTGRREAVSFLFANRQVCARFAQWAKRTNPPLGGESVLRQAIPVPDDIGPQSERLVRALNLEGYSEVEYRRDAEGVPYLMEINPRLSASVEVAVRAGVDFPYLLWQWAAGEPVDRVDSYRTGGWMRYLQGDILSTIETVQDRGRAGVPSAFQTTLGFGLSFFRPMGYDYLDWSDPLPAVRALKDFTRAMVRRSAAGVARRIGGVETNHVVRNH